MHIVVVFLAYWSWCWNIMILQGWGLLCGFYSSWPLWQNKAMVTWDVAWVQSWSDSSLSDCRMFIIFKLSLSQWYVFPILFIFLLFFPRPPVTCYCTISIFKKKKKHLSLENGTHWILQLAPALSCLSGPSASWMVDGEREHVRKRDWNYNRLACIFVPVRGHSERQHLKIALPLWLFTLP